MIPDLSQIDLSQIDMKAVMDVVNNLQQQMQNDTTQGQNPLATLMSQAQQVMSQYGQQIPFLGQNNQHPFAPAPSSDNFNEPSNPVTGNSTNVGQPPTPEAFSTTFMRTLISMFVMGFLNNYIMVSVGDAIGDFIKEKPQEKKPVPPPPVAGSIFDELPTLNQPVGKFMAPKKRRAARPSPHKMEVGSPQESKEVGLTKEYLDKWLTSLKSQKDFGIAGLGNTAAELFNTTIGEGFVAQLIRFLPLMEVKGTPNQWGQFTGRATGVTAGSLAGLVSALYAKKITGWIAGGVILLTYIAGAIGNRRR